MTSHDAPSRNATAGSDGTADSAIDSDVPGQQQFGPHVERFDEAVDAALERIRGNSIADRVFTTASHVGDFSLIWHAIGIARGLILRKPRQIVVLTALLGVESLIVNQGIKRLFKRARPTVSGETGLEVRRPKSSSFPSGHASSATFASSILASWDGPLLGSLWYLIASIVGTSRAFVRIHHASDVVAGVVTGRALAWVARRALRRVGVDHLL